MIDVYDIIVFNWYNNIFVQEIFKGNENISW